MLANPKYIGHWVWGATTTKRDSQGRKKQDATPPDQHQVRQRPDLRIIDQAIWDRTQQRLAELKEKFTIKEGQRPRGPKVHPSTVYPQTLLGGLLVCGSCGGKLWYRGSGNRRYYACSNRHVGRCDMITQVPADRAEEGLVGFLTELLRGCPDWLQQVYCRTRALISEEANRLPERFDEDTRRLAEIDRRIKNLVKALADGALASKAVKQELEGQEEDAQQLRQQLAAYESLRRQTIALPEDGWLMAELQQWTDLLSGDVPKAATALRQALHEVRAEAVVAPGKQRGYARLRFRIQTWEILRALLTDRLIQGFPMDAIAGGISETESPEFVLDLGEPSKMDIWGPQIVQWRLEGVHWEEIVRRTGLDLNRAYIAWKRSTGEDPNGKETV
jgi:hypothetical protein